MFRSIRKTLLFWLFFILLAVIGVFGQTLHVQLWRSTLSEIDTELATLAGRVRHKLEEHEGDISTFRLSDEYAASFIGPEADTPYYVIWGRSGKVQSQSSMPTWRLREGVCEIVVSGPEGSEILVGRSTHDEHKKLRDFLLIILLAGGGVLVLALVGVWFIVSRSLRPIEAMSRDAASISADDLSRRIAVDSSHDELKVLGATLNRTFDSLEAAFRRMAQFISDASHELRTPLSVVYAHLELALRKERTAEEYRDAVETCMEAARRMKSNVDDLLVLARADAGELSLQSSPVDLEPAINDTISLLRHSAKERGVEIAAQTTSVWVDGDVARLKEALSNIVSNGIRYNRQGGRVDVTLEKIDGKAVIRVLDTGIGISSEEIPRIFERFYRVDKTRAREHGGSGLGLSITRWIVEAHGGTIECTSTPGRITEFRIVLSASKNDSGSGIVHAED